MFEILTSCVELILGAVGDVLPSDMRKQQNVCARFSFDRRNCEDNGVSTSSSRDTVNSHLLHCQYSLQLRLRVRFRLLLASGPKITVQSEIPTDIGFFHA